MRKRRQFEVYELCCHICHGTVEIPCSQVRDGIGVCPRCGSRLVIQWREALP